MFRLKLFNKGGKNLSSFKKGAIVFVEGSKGKRKAKVTKIDVVKNKGQENVRYLLHFYPLKGEEIGWFWEKDVFKN